jgi:acyl-CoA thioesterase-1
MKKISLLLLLILLTTFALKAQTGQVVKAGTYLSAIKEELKIAWPKNKTINLVFHGHSVPAGYWHNHEVHTLESYPHLLLSKLKQEYPYAQINVIITAKGGENSPQGQKRFEEVLAYKPDILFIDYSLNDQSIGLEKAADAWEKMIQAALQQNIKVILLTPSPDQRVDILAPDNPLDQHAAQVRNLAKKYQVGLADSFSSFQAIARSTGSVKDYMSHVNHPNQKGHEMIAKELLKWFID